MWYNMVWLSSSGNSMADYIILICRDFNSIPCIDIQELKSLHISMIYVTSAHNVPQVLELYKHHLVGKKRFTSSTSPFPSPNDKSILDNHSLWIIIV